MTEPSLPPPTEPPVLSDPAVTPEPLPGLVDTTTPDTTTPEPRARVPERPARSALAVFTGLGFVLLVGAGFYLWHRLDQLEAEADPVKVAVLESQLRQLQQRLTQIEQTPAPVVAPVRPTPTSSPVDLGPIEQRVAALSRTVTTLEQRPAPPPTAPADLGPIDQRLAALEKRPVPPPAPDLGPLDQRLAALERRPAPPPAPDLGPLQGRIDSLEKKQAQGETQSSQSIDRAARIARLQVAGSALAAGQPLGEIPGAPPALSRYVLDKPPTEASLRLSFANAAAAAAAASQPVTQGQPLSERMWTRISRLVTVRAGDHVLVGAPAAVVLADAQRRLDAGDLPGAVAALAGLDAPAAAAMAGWRGQAQALLDAQTALGGLTTAAMARG